MNNDLNHEVLKILFTICFNFSKLNIIWILKLMMLQLSFHQLVLTTFMTATIFDCFVSNSSGWTPMSPNPSSHLFTPFLSHVPIEAKHNHRRPFHLNHRTTLKLTEVKDVMTLIQKVRRQQPRPWHMPPEEWAWDMKAYMYENMDVPVKGASIKIPKLRPTSSIPHIAETMLGLDQ